MKAQTGKGRTSIVVLAVALTAGFISTAQAVNVNLSIYEDHYPDGTETAWAQWSSDPAAIISVTLDTSRTDGEVWLIDLSASGHRAPGAAWPNGFTVATWEEPEHPGLWNNLYINDPLHLTLESEWQTATGQNMGDYPNGFSNGVSYYAGTDYNGDAVFARVAERAVPEPATATLGLLGMVGLAARRRRRC